MRVRNTLLSAAILVFTCALAAAAARANDLVAEVAIGGLTLLKTDAISMDSEDLYISRDIVRVKYRFTNTTDAPVDALIAFPLPDITHDMLMQCVNAAIWSDLSELKFKTRVDDRPVALHIIERAFFKGKDVSARLSALHIPLNPKGTIDAAIKSLPESDRNRLVTEGLIKWDDEYDPGWWLANWTLRTAVTRRQAFPPKKTITVEHEYVPRGNPYPIEVTTALDPLAPQPADLSELRHKYCVGDTWLHNFKKRLENKQIAWKVNSLGYVLTTGANWKEPIGDFHLIVDTGKPDSLVSFCGDGIKQISPTQFEVRYTNFTPTEDLQLLIVDFADVRAAPDDYIMPRKELNPLDEAVALECSKQADARGLHGKERSEFREECKKGHPAAPQ